MLETFSLSVLRRRMFLERMKKSFDDEHKGEKTKITLSREIFFLRHKLRCISMVFVAFVSNFKLKCPLSYWYFMLHIFGFDYFVAEIFVRRTVALKRSRENTCLFRSAGAHRKKMSWVKNFAVFKAMLWLITLYFSILFIQFKFFCRLCDFVCVPSPNGMSWANKFASGKVSLANNIYNDD